MKAQFTNELTGWILTCWNGELSWFPDITEQNNESHSKNTEVLHYELCLFSFSLLWVEVGMWNDSELEYGGLFIWILKVHHSLPNRIIVAQEAPFLLGLFILTLGTSFVSPRYLLLLSKNRDHGITIILNYCSPRNKMLLERV